MIITPKNLIENLNKIGPWSAYGLAIEALQHYFPNEYDENGDCILGSKREIELLEDIDCNSWQDAIIKYQKEVGFKCKEFNGDCVNEC